MFYNQLNQMHVIIYQHPPLQDPTWMKITQNIRFHKIKYPISSKSESGALMTSQCTHQVSWHHASAVSDCMPLDRRSTTETKDHINSSGRDGLTKVISRLYYNPQHILSFTLKIQGQKDTIHWWRSAIVQASKIPASSRLAVNTLMWINECTLKFPMTEVVKAQMW